MPDPSSKRSNIQSGFNLQWWLPARDVRIALMACILLFVMLNLFLVFQMDSYTSFFKFVHYTYDANTIYLPLLLIVWVMVSFAVSRPLRWGDGYSIALVFAITLVGIRIYATHFEPYNLQVITHEIQSEKLSEPLRIVHFTDVQTGKMSGYEERAFAMVTNMQPDLVLYTGDFLQLLDPSTLDAEIDLISEQFSRIDAPLGVYGVVGNVDGWMNRDRLAQLQGIQILEDEPITLDWHGTPIHLYGLGEYTSVRVNRDALQGWFDPVPEDAFTLVMGHHPDYILDMNDLPIDLCTAGHTHGGQIVVPFYGPIITFSSIPRWMARGLHEYGNTRINVSAGIGSERAFGIPKIRFNCPPDFAVFDFIPAE